MDLDQAAKLLEKKYTESKVGMKVVNIHLFGIEYGSEIENLPIQELVSRAGIPQSYKTEIRKGVSLSKYVEIRKHP